MELNAEQIIKALECCISSDDCTFCPLRDEDSCPCVLKENALALITSQEQRIRDLEVELKAMRGAAYAYKMNIVELTEQRDGCELTIHECESEIKRLSEENKKIGIENFDLVCELSRIKEDTVRKMQERLKKHLEKPEFPWDSFTVAEEVIDQIAKEMLEGEGK